MSLFSDVSSYVKQAGHVSDNRILVILVGAVLFVIAIGAIAISLCASLYEFFKFDLPRFLKKRRMLKHT